MRREVKLGIFVTLCVGLVVAVVAGRAISNGSTPAREKLALASDNTSKPDTSGLPAATKPSAEAAKTAAQSPPSGRDALLDELVASIPDRNEKLAAPTVAARPAPARQTVSTAADTGLSEQAAAIADAMNRSGRIPSETPAKGTSAALPGVLAPVSLPDVQPDSARRGAASLPPTPGTAQKDVKPASAGDFFAELQAAAERHPHLKVMEAFMYRFHPQWIETRNLVADARLGELRSIQTFFSYYNVDPANVRNKPDIGGGGMLDIGCYCISLSRFLFNDEPRRVFGVVEYDPKFKIDRLASGILEFRAGASTFTCSTQLSAFQRVNVIGTAGRIEIEIPFNAPPKKRCTIWHQGESRLRQIRLARCNQYTIQGDLFSQAILNDTDVPTPLDDAVANMRVIDAVFESGRTGTWQTL